MLINRMQDEQLKRTISALVLLQRRCDLQVQAGVSAYLGCFPAALTTRAALRDTLTSCFQAISPAHQLVWVDFRWPSHAHPYSFQSPAPWTCGSSHPWSDPHGFAHTPTHTHTSRQHRDSPAIFNPLPSPFSHTCSS